MCAVISGIEIVDICIVGKGNMIYLGGLRVDKADAVFS